MFFISSDRISNFSIFYQLIKQKTDTQTVSYKIGKICGVNKNNQTLKKL